MVHAADDSAYKKALKPFLDKKKRLAVDVRRRIGHLQGRPLTDAFF
jgi:hypothetical protein